MTQPELLTREEIEGWRVYLTDMPEFNLWPVGIDALCDMALAHLRSQPTRTYSDMTIAELTQERGRIDFALQLKVLGDPSKGVTIPAASPPAGKGARAPRRLGAHGHGEGDA